MVSLKRDPRTDPRPGDVLHCHHSYGSTSYTVVDVFPANCPPWASVRYLASEAGFSTRHGRSLARWSAMALGFEVVTVADDDGGAS